MGNQRPPRRAVHPQGGGRSAMDLRRWLDRYVWAHDGELVGRATRTAEVGPTFDGSEIEYAYTAELRIEGPGPHYLQLANDEQRSVTARELVFSWSPAEPVADATDTADVAQPSADPKPRKDGQGCTTAPTRAQPDSSWPCSLCCWSRSAENQTADDSRPLLLPASSPDGQRLRARRDRPSRWSSLATHPNPARRPLVVRGAHRGGRGAVVIRPPPNSQALSGIVAAGLAVRSRKLEYSQDTASGRTTGMPC